MIGVLGLGAVLVALGASGVLTWVGARSVKAAEVDVVRLKRWAVIAAGASVFAFAALEVGILTHDYSLRYVANTTSDSTPLVFLLASGWAALEGSIVLWGLVLGCVTWLVARRIAGGDLLRAGALSVLGLVGVFWFGLMASVSNPFEVCTKALEVGCAASSWLPLMDVDAPLRGRGPNPLLQNHILMAVHPPLLYVGYVGFTIPFAFAISALWQRITGPTWLNVTHRWALISWAFLTAGILLGAWWSYEVLGWGGYWAWDPVENAAFLPWLVATAFIHSAVVQRRRRMLEAWNIILVISTFSLTILGTFLTRSGIVFSVHSFTQSAVGPVLLGFLGVVVIGGLSLFAVRADAFGSNARLESLASREGVFLANNLLLTLFAFTVLLGTLLPLLVEAYSGNQVSVGRPFFDRAAIPISFALLLAMGIGPVTPYRSASMAVVWTRVRDGIVIGMVLAMLVVVAGVRSIPVVVAVGLAGFVVATIVRQFVSQVGALIGTGIGGLRSIRRLLGNDPSYWGGQISHLGVALLAVAIATSSGLAVRKELVLEVRQTAVVGEYCIGYLGPFGVEEPHRVVEGARVALMEADCSTPIRQMAPRVHRYPNSPQPVATPDVYTGLVNDVYLSLGGLTPDGELLLDVFIFPLMWLLWFGGGVTILGGAVALRSKRHRPQGEGSSGE